MSVKGAVDRRDSNSIEGWVAADDHRDEPLDIDIVYRGAMIGHCLADGDRPASGAVEGARSFRYDVPAYIPKGELKKIEVWIREPSWRVAGGDDAQPDALSNVTTSSAFGGLWLDRSDWREELASRRRSGALSEEVAGQIERFAEDGYIIIENAVPPALVDRLNGEIEGFWSDPPEGMLIETFEPDHQLHYIPPDVRYRDGMTKLLDIYAFSETARQAAAPPKVTAFLSAIFEDKPKAMQGLAFWTGSEQAIHKDSAYVKVDTQPMHLTASWLALEDVSAGTGELEYYVGSHRAPDYLFSGVHKWMESSPQEHDSFLASLHADAAKFGYERASFLPKKGDVLIWHADLAHGGAPITDRGRTRKSLVIHFTASGEEPYYRRHNHHRVLETRRCTFVSNYTDIVATA